MKRLLFVVILAVSNLLFGAVSSAGPMYEGPGQQRSLPAPKSGEVEGFLNSERGPDADIQVLTLESGTQHALETLMAGDYDRAMLWVSATKEFLVSKNKTVPKWLVELEYRTAEGQIAVLLESADIAIHQSLLPYAKVLLDEAAAISREHGGVMEKEIQKMLPKAGPGYGTLLLKYRNGKEMLPGYFNYKI